MPFEELTERVDAGEPDKLASIVLRGPGKPRCIVGIRKVLGEQLKWKPTDKIGVAIGKDDAAGKVRLSTKATKLIGALRPMKLGAFSVDLGHIAAWGMEPKEKTAVIARAVDAHTIEIDVPDWSKVAGPSHDDGAEDQEPDQSRAGAPPEPRPHAAEAMQRPRNGHAPSEGEAVTNGGVMVMGRILTHRNSKIELKPRQAAMIAALVPVLGRVLPEGRILERMGLADTAATRGLLEEERAAMAAPLARAALKLTFTKGIGYTLAKG